MNYLAAIGIEAWRNKCILPGAKSEIIAAVMEFVDEHGPVIRVVYSNALSQSANDLLNQFWQAIENALQCKRQHQMLKTIKDFDRTPVLVLSEKIGVLIKENELISDTSRNALVISADPEAVIENPLLKKTWWNFILNVPK